ncbi:MAG: DUF1003 domain-containing protein [Anaerolineae bacterium]|jgi:uncharacterized membrane protein|nr:DUF1003 domain-containing protein [Anaerolineae bacterium]
MMYNDLIFDRLSLFPDEDADARVEALITEAEELENLLSPEAREIIEDLRPRTVTDDVYEDLDEKATFGQRMADRISTWAGSWTFIIAFLLLMLGWMGVNLALGSGAFDPAPFILLNLTLSTLAALQAPVILMSQNRQASKDRAQAQNDYQVNLKNEMEIVDLHRKVDVLLTALDQQTRLVNALVVARRQEINATVRAIESVRREEMR